MHNAILDHKVMKTPHHEIHKSKEKNGKESTYIKVLREPHLRIQVEWKNGDILGVLQMN